MECDFAVGILAAMKHHTRKSTLSRSALVASLVALVTGVAPVFAQTSGAGTGQTPGSSTSGAAGSSSTETGRRNPQSGTPGTDYQSKAAADIDSTTDVNTRRATSPAGRDKLSWGDRRFVTKAADGGQSEVQLAQLAAQRATNAEVKSYAQKLVDAHTKVNSELTNLASQKNVKLDTDDDQDRAYKRLSKKTGSEFDQEFVEHMIDEHEKDVKMFEKAASEAKDSEIRSFASKHVGHLRDHLQQAQSLRQSVMPTGRIDDSSGRSPLTTPSGPTTTPSTTTPPSTDSSTTGRPRGSSSDTTRSPNGTR